MQFNELQKQTNTNIQEKANLIWESATHLVGLFKPHEYGKVILPMTVLKRFDDALAPTKQAVLERKKKLDATGANEQLIEGALTRTSGSGVCAAAPEMPSGPRASLPARPTAPLSAFAPVNLENGSDAALRQ